MVLFILGPNVITPRMWKIDKGSRLQFVIRKARRRVKSASAAQLILDVLALIGAAVQVTLPLLWAAQNVSAFRIAWIEAAVFLVFVLYGLLHRHFLSSLSKPRRMAEEEAKCRSIFGISLGCTTRISYIKGFKIAKKGAGNNRARAFYQDLEIGRKVIVRMASGSETIRKPPPLVWILFDLTII